ncbi:MAG: aldo/keto reductase [Cytophagaceae bacterium]|nr:aldo/keto reductase [Gemmatimonadaceae bacterium]
MHRRQFLADSAVTLAGLAAAAPAMAQTNAALLTSPIPSTGERIPRIGLGTWQVFDVGSDATRRAGLAETLRVFTQGGGRVVDSSPMYGSSESVLGDLARDARLHDSLWMATKVWTSGEAAGVRQMETSLARLRTERLQLMQVHNLLDWQVHLRTLREWKERGRVKYIGVTHYQQGAFDDVERVLRAERLDFVQLNLSLDEPEAAQRMLSLCAERGVAFLANRPFGGGGALSRVRSTPLPAWASEFGIASWAQYLLKWVLAHEPVTCAIPGTSNPRHMADNLGAARGAPLDARARDRLAAHWRSL